MSHGLKKAAALLLAVALVAGLGFAGASTLTEKQLTVYGGVDVYKEDALLNPKDAGGAAVDTFIYNGTTYLPARAVSEALGLDVDFDATTKTVYIDDLAGNAEKADEYIKHFFGVTFTGTVTLDAWNKAVTAVGGTAVTGTTLTTGDAIESAVNAAGLTELAASYSAEKAAERIAAYGVPAKVSAAAAPAYACALDADLITATADPAAPLDADTATELIMGVAQITGQGRHYIGRISDADIASKLVSALDSITVLSDGGVLDKLGPEIVMRDATTGYNLKYAGYKANFLPEYTLQYGHSDPTHAVQLIELLQSEGFDAYVQIEPKVSIYEYDLSWGEPGPKVTKVSDDFYYTYDIEYDMQLEFETVAEKEEFHSVIEEYAKKYAANQNEDGSFDGLIAGAWWQPLYTSLTPMKNEEFETIYDNVIKNGDYEIHSFSTAANVDAVGKVVSELAPDLKVETVTRYVNPAFWRYINGTSGE